MTYGKRRLNTAIIIQLLFLVRSGVSVRTNLMYFTSVNWAKFNKVLDICVRYGYCSVDDKNVSLTEKGKRFCSFIDEYFDLFSQDLNTFFKYQ